MTDHDDPMRPWRENHRPFGTVDDMKKVVSDEEKAENDLEGDESNGTS